ncbi:MAG: WG repeat-containing protein [Flavobacteriales bacterium]|nr:WG repeat-containing protein [Flavobacteriales bacterium]
MENTQKKLSLLFLCAVMCISFNSCKTGDEDVKLFPVKAGGLWGYVDSKGKYVINPQFSNAYCFSEGLARVQSSDGKFGFISEDGRYIINPIYKDANNFTEGMACVVLENGRPQFIDTKGNINFSIANVDLCYGFSEGLAGIAIHNNRGFIDKLGNLVIRLSDTIHCHESFSDGLVPVASRDRNHDELIWGFMNSNGNIAIDFQFREVLSFRDGIAFVATKPENGFELVSKEWGCIDKKGNFVIAPQFERDFLEEHHFNNGVSVARQGGKYGYINTQGNYVVNPQYNNAKPFMKNHLAAVQNSDEKWGFINEEGLYHIDSKFDDVATGFFGDIAFVKSGDKWGIINEKGEYVVVPQFDDVNLQSIEENDPIRSDYTDNVAIAEMILENSSSTSFRGYSMRSTINQVSEKNQGVDFSSLGTHSLGRSQFQLDENHNIVKMLYDVYTTYGFSDAVSGEKPVFETVSKYDIVTKSYHNVNEFVRMEQVIYPSAPLSSVSMQFVLSSHARGIGKTLAEEIRNQAIEKMHMIELTNLRISNSELKGMYILTSDEFLAYIRYAQTDVDDYKVPRLSQPRITIVVVNRNYKGTFSQLARELENEFMGKPNALYNESRGF